MASNKPNSKNSDVPCSRRIEQTRAMARARAVVQAARRWADAAALAHAWDANRYAWLAHRATGVVCHEAEQTQKAQVDQAVCEVMQRCIALAQEHAQRAKSLSKQVPRVPIGPALLEHLHQAEMNAWDAYLRYSDDGQPEAELEIADLRAAYDRVHRQRLLAEHLFQRLAGRQEARLASADDVSAEP